MGSTEHDHHDPIWEAAWAWVVRHHEDKYADDATTQALAQWLAADPRHCDAYQKASRLWLMAGLVPPVGDVGIPDAPDAEST